MNWRGVHIVEAARLSVRQRQLLIEQDRGSATIPLEDLAFIILDTQRVSLSAALLAACAEVDCLVVVCDGSHMPNGALLPCQGYHRHTATLLAQIALSEPRRKNLWKRVVQGKIHNQADCLARIGRSEADVGRIRAVGARVRSGDVDNAEGVAARLYWRCWIDGFDREQEGDDRLNVMLNYGYAIVRAVIARELAGRGFSPSLGIHHRGMANAFNLADDMIEPWRPFVDELVLRHWLATDKEEEFSVADRRVLVRVLHADVVFDSESMKLMDAVRRQTEQLLAWVMKERDDVALPVFGSR